MKYDPQKHHRRSIRLPEYDYSQAGAYFITLCTWGREPLFGEIYDGVMRLSAAGRIVKAEWKRLARQFTNIHLVAFVVMPNHMHGIIVIDELGEATRYMPDDTISGNEPAPKDAMGGRGGSPVQEGSSDGGGEIRQLPDGEGGATRHLPIDNRSGTEPMPNDAIGARDGSPVQDSGDGGGTIRQLPGGEVGATRHLPIDNRSGTEPMPNDAMGGRDGSPVQDGGDGGGEIRQLPGGEGGATRYMPDDTLSGNEPAPKDAMGGRDGSPVRDDPDYFMPKGPAKGSLGAMIGQFKSRATKRIWSLPEYDHAPIWQRNYYEHIIRSREDYERIRAYIQTNPLRWVDDQLHPAAAPNPFNQE